MTKKICYHIKQISVQPNTKIVQTYDNDHSIIFVLAGKGRVDYKSSYFNSHIEDFILLSGEHRMIFINTDKKRPFVLLTINFKNGFFELLSTQECPLLECYHKKNEVLQVVSSTSEKSMLMKNLCFKLLSLEEDVGFGVELFKKSTLTMLFIIVNRACQEQAHLNEKSTRKTFLIDSIFLYINNHINEEITLQQLEAIFFVSRFHLSREFKKHTGTTIHKYIMKRKLEIAKELLKSGLTATEVNNRCHLGELNNFYRVFKKEYGLTPKEYVLEIKKNNTMIL